jgi:ribose transport system permease protein
MSKTGTQSTAAPTPATRPTTQPAAWRRIAASYRTEIAIAAAIILLELVLGLFIPNALTMGNFSDIAQATAPLIIMAIGVLLVVITGGIDLSVGSVFSLAGMVTGLVMVSGYSSTVATI